MLIRFLILGLAATAIACVHVPSEVEATFAPRDPDEASNFHKSSRPGVSPSSPVPVPAPVPVPVPASSSSAPAKGGEA